MENITPKVVLTEEQKSQCIAIDTTTKEEINALPEKERTMAKVQEILNKAIAEKNVIKNS